MKWSAVVLNGEASAGEKTEIVPARGTSGSVRRHFRARVRSDLRAARLAGDNILMVRDMFGLEAEFDRKHV